MRNPKEIARIRTALRENPWGPVVCAVPMNLPRLSGYWPVAGTGVALASSDGRSSLLVPHGEEDLAKCGWADKTRTFKPGPWKELRTTADGMQCPLPKLAKGISAATCRVGFEAHETFEPVCYAAMHLYGGPCGLSSRRRSRF